MSGLERVWWSTLAGANTFFVLLGVVDPFTALSGGSAALALSMAVSSGG